MAARTFPDALRDRVAGAAGQPLVTFYDDATGERVELSAATYANWVAKTAALLQDELDVAAGDRVLVDLPPHWLGTVWLGAAWSVGAVVATTGAGARQPAAVVCGPGGWDDHAAAVAAGTPVVALSLRPMGARFEAPPPAGVVDYGAVVWGQPDDFWPADPVGPDAVAWADGEAELSQGTLLARAATGPFREPGTRLLTEAAPASLTGCEALLGPMLAGGGTVWVRHPRPDQWSRHAETERTTRELRLS